MTQSVEKSTKEEELNPFQIQFIHERFGSISHTGRIIKEINLPQDSCGLYCVCFSPKEDLFITACGSGSIQIRSAHKGMLIATVRGGMDHNLPAMCIRFHPREDNLFFVASSCGYIFQCLLDTEKCSRFLKEDTNSIYTLDMNPIGYNMATSGKDAGVRIYDINTKQVLSSYEREQNFVSDIEANYHSKRVFALKFAPTSNEIFLTGGWDDIVKMWDMRVAEGFVRNIYGPHICGEAIDIKGDIMLTGSWVKENSLQLWDLGSGNLIENIGISNRPDNIIGEYLYSAQFLNGDFEEDLIVAGGSGTYALEVISKKEKEIVSWFPTTKAIQGVASKERKIVYGGMEAKFRIAEVK